MNLTTITVEMAGTHMTSPIRIGAYAGGFGPAEKSPKSMLMPDPMRQPS